MRQPGTDDDDREPRLGDLVNRRTQRRDVLGSEVLHLVDEDRDPPARLGGQPTDVGQQLDEVDLDIPGVGTTRDGGGGDAGVPAVAQPGGPSRSAAGLTLGERLDHTECVVDGLPGAQPELAHGLVQRRRQRTAQ